uniref:G-protein coupled receptors family 1 profile domain-containing protein n=1 Tax=Acrobeloides nanus TaxID=290746 RepID=A0A914C2Y2_9BILA
MSTDELYLPTIVNIIAVFAILFCNTNIIIATIRNKSLQQPCNFLIALHALADMVTQFGCLVFAYYLFSDTIYTTRLTCVYLQSPSMFSSMFGLVIILAIGIDRMVGIVKPLR